MGRDSCRVQAHFFINSVRVSFDTHGMVTIALAVAICILMLAVGLRVLGVARTSGGSTEALIGTAFVAMSLGGLPALFSGHEDVFPSATARPVLFAFGQALLSLAFACLYLFAWRCFGPDSGWRRVLALAGVTSQIAVFGALGLVEGYEPTGGSTIRVAVITRGVVMLWAFAESLRYWQLMKRRQRLGLVDPVVVNRFALWSCWTGGLVGCIVVAAISRLFLGKLSLDFSSVRDSALLLAGMCALVVSVGSLLLAFLPPAAYLRWVRRSAEA
jgi:hypothetical protein